MTIIGVEFDRRKWDIVHLLSFLSNLHGTVSKFSPLSTSLHCHVYRGPHDLSIAEMKKYNFLIRKKKKKKDRMANGTLPLSRLMRLQMAHMRRAQCCLSDFCSVSKVTMIDGYFWINNHFLLSLYAWKNIYIFVCIYINTRASKFHWTSSPVITDGNESSSPCFLQLNTNFFSQISNNLPYGVTLEGEHCQVSRIITAHLIFRTGTD